MNNAEAKRERPSILVERFGESLDGVVNIASDTANTVKKIEAWPAKGRASVSRESQRAFAERVKKQSDALLRRMQVGLLLLATGLGAAVVSEKGEAEVPVDAKLAKAMRRATEKKPDDFAWAHAIDRQNLEEKNGKRMQEFLEKALAVMPEAEESTEGAEEAVEEALSAEDLKFYTDDILENGLVDRLIAEFKKNPGVKDTFIEDQISEYAKANGLTEKQARDLFTEVVLNDRLSKDMKKRGLLGMYDEATGAYENAALEYAKGQDAEGIVRCVEQFGKRQGETMEEGLYAAIPGLNAATEAGKESRYAALRYALETAQAQNPDAAARYRALIEEQARHNLALVKADPMAEQYTNSYLADEIAEYERIMAILQGTN